jgi:predicted DsbA family dithiol-disulfide isomerase
LTGVRATVWNDYVCPWSYLGRHRSGILSSMGVAVDRRPFELHPDLPASGRPVRPRSGLAAVLERVAADCAIHGVAFTVPTHTPNSRLALRIFSLVAATEPRAADQVDDALSDARWVEGRDISDTGALSEIIDRTGLNGSRVVAAALDGEGEEALVASMDEARDAGVTATPAWRFDTGFVMYGVQDPETIRRWVRRMQARVD